MTFGWSIQPVRDTNTFVHQRAVDDLVGARRCCLALALQVGGPNWRTRSKRPAASNWCERLDLVVAGLAGCGQQVSASIAAFFTRLAGDDLEVLGVESTSLRASLSSA